MTTTEMRIPPQDLRSERALLGCALNPEYAAAGLDELAAELEPGMFYNDIYGKLYGALLAMRSQNVPIDMLTVARRMEESGLADEIDVHTIDELLAAAPYIPHWRHYAKAIRDCHRRRLALRAAQEIDQFAYDKSTPIEDALAQAETTLHEAIAGVSGAGLKPISGIVLGALDAIDSPDTLGISTGFVSLDQKSKGLKPGNQIIIAARPGVGKTALAGCIGRNVAAAGHGVLFVSYEMTGVEIVQRLIALISGVAVDDFKQYRDAVRDAAEELNRLPLFVDDSQPGVNQLVGTIRLAARKGVRVVVVDYLQLVPPEDARVIREQQIAGISRRLKQVALGCGVTVIALSQLNRAVENRDGQRPRLSDLRESGAIEQDADQVWLLWHPVAEGKSEATTETMLDVAKHRNGQNGMIKLGWHGPTTSFRDYEEKY